MPVTDPPIPDVETAAALESLLRWYTAMGVDAAVDDVPHDRFAPVDPPARVMPSASHETARSQSAPPTPQDVPAAADALVQQARALAAAAPTIEALQEAWQGFKGCALATTASKMIFAGGNSSAKIMILGAAPGSDDERQGVAFAGPAGRLLDGMLAAIGQTRDSVYLVNVIPWRPPGNRPPTPLEAALCLPFTRRHIALADPAIMLCLGERGAQILLDTKEPLAKLRGRWLSFEGETKPVKLAVTFSLDYLLSQPLQKRRAWLDLIVFSKMMAREP